mmetsp:Transcript_53082/g.151222  ORF Transcript_53082/g.151222 Transcript_53082/m.151222 type:complete len:335 (+) Transcript_53082:239-1243(+)
MGRLHVQDELPEALEGPPPSVGRCKLLGVPVSTRQPAELRPVCRRVPALPLGAAVVASPAHEAGGRRAAAAGRRAGEAHAQALLGLAEAASGLAAGEARAAGGGEGVASQLLTGVRAGDPVDKVSDALGGHRRESGPQDAHCRRPVRRPVDDGLDRLRAAADHERRRAVRPEGGRGRVDHGPGGVHAVDKVLRAAAEGQLDCLLAHYVRREVGLVQPGNAHHDEQPDEPRPRDAQRQAAGQGQRLQLADDRGRPPRPEDLEYHLIELKDEGEGRSIQDEALDVRGVHEPERPGVQKHECDQAAQQDDSQAEGQPASADAAELQAVARRPDVRAP